MVNPVPGQRITTPYHRTGKLWTACGWHTGVDFQAPKGAPIVAAISGTIRHRGYGNAFGPFQFAISPSKGQPFEADEVFYAHVLDRLPNGTEVKAGQVISHVGDLGNATGPHLHFEYHKGKNVWNCSVMRDPKPAIDWQAPVLTPTPTPPASTGPYVTKDIYSNKLGYGEPTNGDASSDTIKELQERLNRTKLVGGQSLPVTGKYWIETDEEVRLWQAQVVNDTPDPVNKSYLGPAQRAKMFPSPPYTIHDAGLPAIAAGGGAGSIPGPVDPAAPSPPPAAPDLKYPDAIWDPVPKTSGGYFTGLRPFTGYARKVTLHTTESTSKPNWTAQQAGIPHFTADLARNLVWQHLPLDMAAYTLKGGERSPNSDSGVNIQIEVVGFARTSQLWPDADYTHLVRLIEWITNTCAVPWSFPCVFGDNGEFMRLSWEAWFPMNGIMGHQHAPYNDHWDPGKIDVVRMNYIHDMAGPVVPEEPLPPIPMPEPPTTEPEPEPEPGPDPGPDPIPPIGPIKPLPDPDFWNDNNITWAKDFMSKYGVGGVLAIVALIAVLVVVLLIT